MGNYRIVVGQAHAGLPFVMTVSEPAEAGPACVTLELADLPFEQARYPYAMTVCRKSDAIFPGGHATAFPCVVGPRPDDVPHTPAQALALAVLLSEGTFDDADFDLAGKVGATAFRKAVESLEVPCDLTDEAVDALCGLDDAPAPGSWFVGAAPDDGGTQAIQVALAMAVPFAADLMEGIL